MSMKKYDDPYRGTRDAEQRRRVADPVCRWCGKSLTKVDELPNGWFAFWASDDGPICPTPNPDDQRVFHFHEEKP